MQEEKNQNNNQNIIDEISKKNVEMLGSDAIGPNFAGVFYPKNFTDLNEKLEELFEKGPGDTPISKREKQIFGVIVPHAGYDFSGDNAAWAYKEIGEAEFPDVYIILSSDHHNIGTVLAKKPFVTPFGKINVAVDLSNELQRKGLVINDSAFENEHAIEVQLPFLQFVSKDKIDKIKILPIIVGEDWREIGIIDKLIETLKLYGKKAVFIVSSDLIHYGRKYNYTPYVYNIEEETKKMNETVINYILEKDPKEFEDLMKQTKATVCGKNAITLFLEILNKMKPEAKSRLLMYSNSKDKNGEVKNNFGYASILFY